MASLILHDLPANLAAQLLPESGGQREEIFAALPMVKPCVGCFGCWTKTPGRCVIGDRGSDFAALMPRRKEVVVVSRMVFGGFSPAVKAVLDRSIGFMLPFFELVGGEMHHKPRYKEAPNLRYFFYGEISEKQQDIAQRLAAANALNFGAQEFTVQFFGSPQEAAEALV